MEAQASSPLRGKLRVTTALIAGALVIAAGAPTTPGEEDHKTEKAKPEISALSKEAIRLEIESIGGEKVKPLAPEKGAFSIVLFTATECPIANAFSPEIARIAAEFAEKKCRLYLVYTDPELEEAAIRKHLREYNLKSAVAILDKAQRLVAATGATLTPEAAVIDSAGRMLYRGRINNRFAALGKKRRVVTSHDLRDALSAVIEGKPVKNPRTEAIGCYIPTLPTPLN